MGDREDAIEHGLRSEGQRRPAQRPIYEYDLPEAIAAEVGFSTIGVQVLTGNEYEMALNRTRGNPMRLAMELPKAALAAVGGQRVSLADGSADKAWEQLGPKGRELVTVVYGELHTTEAQQTEAFLKSRRVVVG